MDGRTGRGLGAAQERRAPREDEEDLADSTRLTRWKPQKQRRVSEGSWQPWEISCTTVGSDCISSAQGEMRRAIGLRTDHPRPPPGGLQKKPVSHGP